MAEFIKVTTINLWERNFLLKGALGVNCYLIKTGNGFVLIDTGFHSRKKEFETILENSGCRTGNLNLIIITHGDLDHIGNCKSLKKKYNVKIAIHSDELESIVKTNMTLNRKKKQSNSARILLSILGYIFKANRFYPDIYINDGENLSKYGLNATVLHLPGHSKGSIGILTAEYMLDFCLPAWSPGAIPSYYP